MPEESTTRLLTQDSAQLEKITFELAFLLEQIPFERVLKAKLIRAQEALEKEEITPSEYLKKPILAQARDILENRQNTTFLLGSLVTWYNQAHSFSTYQKFCLTVATITLIAAAVLSREIFILLSTGKPDLEETGAKIKYYCTTGLTTKVTSVCSSLADGMKAVYSMMPGAPIGNPVYHGPANATVTIPPQTIPSWILPTGWVNYFTCERRGNITEMEGTGFFGSEQDAMQRASNGFPIARASIANIQNLLVNFIEFYLEISGFFIDYCVKTQNGFYSAYENPNNAYQDYGPTNGIERGGNDLKHSAYAFGGVYGGIAGVALLAALFLLAKKACEKWDAGQRVYNACALFKESDACVDASDTHATVVLPPTAGRR